jgi:hypothetical protein
MRGQMEMRDYMKSNRMFFAAIGFFLVNGFGANVLLSALATATLLLALLLLWRPGESPILLFIFCFQWVQFSALIFYGNWLSLGVQELNQQEGGNVERAIVLSQIALIFLAIGMRLGAGNQKLHESNAAKEIAGSYPISYFFRFYLVVFGIALFSRAFAYVIPGLSQLFLAVSNMRWAFFFMLAFATFTQKDRSKSQLLAAFVLELVWGVGGYFADFKAVFIVTALAAVTSNVRMSAKATSGLGILFSLLLILAVVWTAIKPEYRDYVSGGQQAQVVTVGFGDRLNKIYELVAALDEDSLSEGANGLIRRISYVGIFGAAVDYVPRVVAHEDGALWQDAIVRPFMPRLFFPDKSVIDDSIRTNMYTGLNYSGSDQGTSISIGYVGEAYVDFGEIGMMAPIVLLGLFFGQIYRRCVTSGLFGMGLASAVLLDSLSAETSITKLFGGIMCVILVAWLVRKYLAPLLFRELLSR